MKGIMFGNYHSWRDFNLILATKTIGTPSPKTETIDIPGGDGVLDLTEFFGETKYNNRSHSFEFSSMVIPSEFMALFSRVQNALHGKKMPIIEQIMMQKELHLSSVKCYKNYWHKTIKLLMT